MSVKSLTTLLWNFAMRSVLREVPSKFHYLVFSSTEEGEWEENEEPPLESVRYANEFQQPKLPKSFYRFLKSLLSSTDCEYAIRCHNTGTFSETEDVCSNFTGEHYHKFLYLKAFVGAENFIKESMSETITRSNPPLKIRNNFVNLLTVSYLENCKKREASYGCNRLFIHGERMKSMLQTKSTKDGMQIWKRVAITAILLHWVWREWRRRETILSVQNIGGAAEV